jgi:predicted AAA+ superfamily ATPase
LKLIAYLAVKKPGSTSASAIAQSLNLNIRTVNNILSALEKSELLFTVNAYGSAGKMLKKPSEHFFATPSIKAAQNYRVGRYDLNHGKCYGALAENMVAASLLKLSKKTMQALGVFYDADRKGVDFVVKHLDRTIPVEVGVGKKTKSQLTRAINKFDAEYGILISNRTSKITFERNVINIPLLTFALM